MKIKNSIGTVVNNAVNVITDFGNVLCSVKQSGVWFYLIVVDYSPVKQPMLCSGGVLGVTNSFKNINKAISQVVEAFSAVKGGSK